MKRAVCALAGLVLLALPVWAQDAPEKSWSLEATADRSSIYLFRGVDLLDDESVIAPWAKASCCAAHSAVGCWVTRISPYLSTESLAARPIRRKPLVRNYCALQGLPITRECRRRG